MQVSRDKYVLQAKYSTPCFPYEYWLYFDRLDLNESEKDPLVAIIIRRTYLVWP